MLFRHENPRKLQSELIEDIYQVCSKGQIGFFEAPTGLGKTDAALAGALEFALKNKKKVFFVTPKSSQHKMVVDVISDVNKKFKTKLRVIDFVSKPNMCSDPFIFGGGSEFYDLCDRKVKTKSCPGYKHTIGFSKIDKKSAKANVLRFLDSTFTLDHDEIRDKCILTPQMCPYELSLELAKFANVVVLDVNHIFVPSIRQKFLARMNVQLEDVILVFDEAHNLPSRIRGSQGASLTIKNVQNAISDMQRVPERKIGTNTKRFLDDFYATIIKFEEGFLDYNSFDSLFANYNYDNTLNALIKGYEFYVNEYEKNSAIKNVTNFISEWYSSRESVSRFVDSKGVLHAKSLDPSRLSAEVLEEVYSAIFMSGTLSPAKMYGDLLLKNRGYISKKYGSPFPKENKYVSYVSDVTTKYDERQKSIPKICDIIVDTVNTTTGNIAVFFPSYIVMEQIYDRVSKRTQKRIFMQKRGSNPRASLRLINDFKKAKTGLGGVLFGAIGGLFSEGVDFPADDLIGVIVVGLPFPEPGYEMKSLIEYYNKIHSNKGWDYAYINPTISKIIQATGRAIRSENDKAFILFLDKRYAWSKYNSLFPKDFDLSEYNPSKFKAFRSNI